MHTQCRNIYQSARAAAGLTQEAAAEQLAVSVESIRAYETGQRTPPASTVFSMSDVYGTPFLRCQHARAVDELGVVPRVRERPFALVAIGLYNYMLEFAEKRRGQQLLRIAADGVIDDAERPLVDEIICELEGIAAAWLSLKCLAPPGIKKERSDAGTSKRSGIAGKAGNHCMNSITGPAGNGKIKFCSGEEAGSP